MKTEFGQIADLTQNLAQGKGPLQKELDHLTKQISVILPSISRSLLYEQRPGLCPSAFVSSLYFRVGMIGPFIPEGLL